MEPIADYPSVLLMVTIVHSELILPLENHRSCSSNSFCERLALVQGAAGKKIRFRFSAS